MPSITGNEIVTDAFALLNVFLPGESVPAADGTFARRMLNDMLSEWAIRGNLLSPVVSRERFNLVADQGGPDNPYTIGSGGDFNTVRPPTQNSIVSANLILTATTPEVRVPLGIYTDQSYDANQLPGMSNTQPTGLYYNPTYANELGSIYLWPVPSVSTNDLEIFTLLHIASFANLTTTYFVPDGFPRLVKYNLASTLQVPYGRDLSEKAERIAVNSLDTFKRANTKLSDLMNDAYLFTYGRQTLYNINTGSGGGA